MKTMRLTDDEVKMVNKHRDEIHHQKANAKFRKEVFELAYTFNKYLEAQQMESSFSEFINCFDPPHDSDNRLKYDAVEMILNTVKSLEIHKKK